MSAPQPILDLLERFERNREAYRSPQYNETQLRREFLDPFFKALGWDIDNEQGYAEAYKDVIHEDAIKVGEGTKAPDYCFRIGGARKFFLEAKKPSVDIKHDVSPAFQLRRYGFTTELPLNILSDFEEFAVYDCRFKPDQHDKAAVGRILYIACTEYATRWDEIANVFSRDAVLKGAFDKFAETNKAKRGTSDLDDEFLKTIEGWRSELARNLALRNPKLTQRELNFAVQRIIDRIIFLRICEGRGIEDYGRLQALANGDRIYPRLAEMFLQADDRFNSGLFHFKREKGRQEAPDELTLGLDLDDKLLRDILRSLYYPDCPYVFSHLPADILGQVYEQFLGKVIRLTEGHRAVVEEKPEVKKAGGVFYTPTYIGEYIVQNTVGKLLDEIIAAVCDRRKARDKQDHGPRPPLQHLNARQATEILARAAKLRILDLACGSGSLLLCAYEHLLKWHLDFYTRNDPTKWAKGSKPVLVQVSGGNWRLTIAERKRILLDNIYGVDIDAQAVETTKLSLLLKVLEGETQQSLQPVLRMFQERALPDLGDNIKCGNSLIGPDFYQQQQMTLLTEDERYRINVFDWHKEFPHIFRRKISTGEVRETAAASPMDYTMPGVPLHGSYSEKKKKLEKDVMPPEPIEPEWEGGFDAVIGNPPYIRIQTMKDSQPQEVEFFNHAYKAARRGNYDIYVVFVERAVSLLNRRGRQGFILPHKFFNAQYGEALRQYLSDGKHVCGITHFGHQQVFNGATTYTCLLFTQKSPAEQIRFAKVDDLKKWAQHKEEVVDYVPAVNLTAADWIFAVGPASALLDKLRQQPATLESVTDRIFQGLKTSADKIYIVEERERKGKQVLVWSPEKQAEYWIEAGMLHPLIKGGDSRRYAMTKTQRLILFPYRQNHDGSVELISQAELKKQFPKTWDYFCDNKTYLDNREDGRFRGTGWYQFGRSQALDVIPLAKLFTPDLAACASFSFDQTGECFFTGGVAGGYGLLPKPGVSPKFLLGLLNSRLLNWVIVQTGTQMRGGYFSFEARFIRSLPIPQLDLTKPADKARHDQMVKLVEQMLELHKSMAAARTPPEKTSLERQIAATDAQIDRLVYDLYGLTEEEIKIVEGAAK